MCGVLYGTGRHSWRVRLQYFRRVHESRITSVLGRRVVRNRVVGISPKSQHGGISYYTGRFDQNGAYYGTMAYEIEMLDNFISGVPSAVPVYGATEAPPYSGLAVSAATFSSLYNGNPVSGDGKNTVMDRNQLSDLATGVTITHSLYGTLIADNTFTPTVTTFLEDTGSINTEGLATRRFDGLAQSGSKLFVRGNAPQACLNQALQ